MPSSASISTSFRRADGQGNAQQSHRKRGRRNRGPAAPGNVPLIGQSRVSNLYLNTGHGTLGWTHACGSGKALADIVSGRLPELDFAFQGMAPNRRASPQAAAVNTVRTPV